MKSIKENVLKPRFVRFDAATVCQLKCPLCPTASGETGRNLGGGFLKFEDFKAFIRQNPYVAHIELSNWGEVFLNKDLPNILAHAYRHNVCLYAGNGANMNHIREDCAEAMVKYKLRTITCSIDGASQETYVQYRVKGSFDQVIANIKMINRIKARYHSPYPRLKWQFVVFGHNEHEVTKAREMAKALDMDFYLKLSWEGLYDRPDFSPVKDKDLIRRETGLGAASRKEFLEKYGYDYVERSCCKDLWTAPQINADGRMLGCPINYWGDYGNVLDGGLDTCLNGEKMSYARDMLMGKREAREDIPCAICKVYQSARKDQAWITEEDVQSAYRVGRKYIMFENKILGEKGTASLVALINQFNGLGWAIRKAVKNRRWRDFVSVVQSGTLPNRGYPLPIPLSADVDKKWKPHFLFQGSTKGIKDFSCHASFLVQGHCPHPPHIHKEEEILMMLDGEADLLLPRYQGPDGQTQTRLKPGEFVYYPPGFPHTLRTASETPANYLMFKWYTPAPTNAHDVNLLSFGHYKIFESLSQQKGKGGFHTRTVFEGPSACLSRLQCHTSVLAPGAGYAPHVDRYDVAIVILEGEVETLGQRFKPHSVLFHPAGKRHGLSNPGNVTARYIVFEFQK